MTDRELLERAGEAFGFDHISVHANGKVYGHDGICNPVAWNPLTDDGDALRLAVKLRLLVLPSQSGQIVTVDSFTPIDEATENAATDPCAATRRAIVRAAAALGEQGK